MPDNDYEPDIAVRFIKINRIKSVILLQINEQNFIETKNNLKKLQEDHLIQKKKFKIEYENLKNVYVKIESENKLLKEKHESKVKV